VELDGVMGAHLVAAVTVDVDEIDAKIDAAVSHFFGPATPGADLTNP
jgi:hypothetical protein